MTKVIQKKAPHEHKPLLGVMQADCSEDVQQYSSDSPHRCSCSHHGTACRIPALGSLTGHTHLPGLSCRGQAWGPILVLERGLGVS